MRNIQTASILDVKLGDDTVYRKVIELATFLWVYLTIITLTVTLEINEQVNIMTLLEFDHDFWITI